MLINIGSNRLVRKREIVGIFDLDTASHEKDTKDFLKACEKKKILEMCGNDLPKAFVLTASDKKKEKKEKKTTVFLTTLSSASLAGRNK